VPELFDEDEKIVLFNAFAITGGFKTLTEYLPKFKNVKFLLSPYSSYAGLDLDVVKKLGIRYRNNSGANTRAVAQYAIAGMFGLLSRFTELGRLASMPDGSLLGEEYHTKTAGIIGMRNVGEELLNTLNGLNIPTVFYNRTPKAVSAKQVSFEEVFQQDIIFIAIANNPETRQLLSAIADHIQERHYLIDISAYDELYDKAAVLGAQLMQSEGQ
jgi:lactate dehydrogenase-like 2-hydroxyacid dehydrogenase